jgi:hypothetical protein
MYKCIEACAKFVLAHVMFRDLPTAEYGTIAEWPVRGRLALSNHYFRSRYYLHFRKLPTRMAHSTSYSSGRVFEAWWDGV